MINAYKNFLRIMQSSLVVQHVQDFWWVWLGNFILSIPFWVIYIYTVYLSAVMDSVSDSASEAAFMIFGFSCHYLCSFFI